MVWAIQLIGSHPEVQKKLHEEMDEIFGDSDRPATMADISNMKYLECVMKESLRLFPSVAQMGRLVEEDTDIGKISKDRNFAKVSSYFSSHPLTISLICNQTPNWSVCPDD